MRIIVTGGAGFIGSAMCRFLVRETDDLVLNIDKLTYAGTLESLREVTGHNRYRFAQADICDRPALEALFEEFRPDAVIHLAAESHVDRSIVGSSAFVHTNVVGTLNLLEVSRLYWADGDSSRRDQFRFLHVSTDEVYGSLLDGRFTEETPYSPRSPYAATKASADHLVAAWHATYGLPTIITNCSNNYGPFHFPEKLIPLTILNAIAGKPIGIYGDGSNVRDWLHVSDHVRALHQILRSGKAGRKYNVGANNERTNNEVAARICDCLDEFRPDGAPHRSLITYVTDRPGHDERYAIDPQRLCGELGWQAQIPFETGIETTVRWYLDNEWWWKPLRERYAGERLGILLGQRS
jgi:dTDP-glucose 4,6-dehydratase